MIKTKKIAIILSCLAISTLIGATASAQSAPGGAAPKTNSVVTIPIQHYLVSLSYNGSTGIARVTSTTLVAGAAKVAVEPTGGWRYDVVTAQGEVINHHFIAVPTNCQSANVADPKAKVTCTEKSQFDLSLEIPYDVTAKNINVYSPSGKMIAFVNVSEFSQTCGDGVCEPGENYKTCPQDCRSGIKDGYCDGVADGVCDPDCTASQDPDCAKLATATQSTQKTGGASAFPIVVLAIVIVIIAAAAVIMFIKKKKGQTTNNGEPSKEQAQPGDPSQNNQQ